MKRSDLVLTLAQRLLLLVCIFIVCYMITLVCVRLLDLFLEGRPTAILRISSILQDVLTFVVPAIVTAIIVTRRPAELLCIPSVPKMGIILIVVGVLFASIPAQEAVIYWNYNIKLPESMAGFETFARQMEDASFNAMSLLMSNPSIGSLIVNLLIIGFAAGFSEELLFRGCFQRLLTTGGVNPHIAVWTVAIVFSAMHLQFFGFIPRILLGAYFGYLLLWTRCIWVPVLAHTLNNMMFVLTAWKQVSEGQPLTNEPSLWSPESIIGSVAVTAVLLWLAWKYGRKLKVEF